MATQAQIRRLYESRFGAPPHEVLPLPGDGSSRKMFRLSSEAGESVIAVVGPDREENRAFLTYSQNFRSIGLNVPEVFAADLDAGIYLEEDLGDLTLFDALSAFRSADSSPFPAAAFDVYRRVVHALPRFQVEGGRVVDYSVAYPRAAFDRQSILWDLNYFKYHFLKLAHIPFNEERLERDFKRLTAFLLRADTRHFLYRDFQSKNIMLRGGEPWFIDYQGGRRGALQYDIASLLFDAKAALPEETRELLLGEYLDALSQYVQVDREQFREHFRGYVLVRIMQAMGAYGYRGFYERKARFLQSVPPAIQNIERLLALKWLPLRLPELEDVFERMVASRTLRRAPIKPPEGFTVHVSSFSYRGGYPEDMSGHGGGYVFDCRALPNPGREALFTDFTGRDACVQEFLSADAACVTFWEAVRTLVEAQVHDYLRRGFNSLTVSFGCTGGQHRSVFFAERLSAHLSEHFKGLNLVVTHREEAQWPNSAASEPVWKP